MGRRRGAWAALLLLLPVTRCADFSDTHLYVTPSNTQEAVEIQLDFRITQRLNGSDVVYVQLPKFTIGGGGKTPGENVPRGELILSPSVYFEGQWDEGAFDSTADPFRNTTLSLYVREEVRIPPNTVINLRLYKSNDIRVYCGFDDVEDTDDDEFFIWTNSSASKDGRFSIEKSDRVGNGCSAMSDCAGKGSCDFCKERCMCYTGHGSGDGYRQVSSIDCSLLECPVGPAWGAIPKSDVDGGHAELVMCSNAGECLMEQGECECFDGFTGEACQRRVCANYGAECGDHGQCLTMHQLAMRDDAFPLTGNASTTYGSAVSGFGAHKTWDFETMQGCLCDSDWAVGLGDGETQVAEYFGADCSRRRCPSGRDPSSKADGTDCSNVTTPEGYGVGSKHNKCHYECSGRGNCDYGRGTCSCFAGYAGAACDRLIGNAAVVG